MNIELKSMQFYVRKTKKSLSYNATIYIEDYSVGKVLNAGNGNESEILVDYHDQKAADLYNQAEKYCLGLPPIEVDECKVPMTLEMYLDRIAAEEYTRRVEKEYKAQAEKHQDKYLLVEAKDGNSYTKIRLGTQTYPHSVSDLVKTEFGRAALKNAIRDVKRKLKDGEKIINTNIPKEILQA